MSDKPEKMDLRSMDISAGNRAKLKQLFPSVFTETRNDTGDLVESIDFEKLKAELGTFTDLFEKRRERYGMDWPGKKDAMRLIQQPSVGTLKLCREESVDFDNTEHLFIEGDNLEVLKLLQKAYYGKVKVICIDPPYNTGKEFIYPDNYSETLDTYLSYAGLADDAGRRFSTNTPNEGRFHTKWLNMMYPRLYLARNLLQDDGVIFIHIDDNEVCNLRKLCDEIFGEENFVESFIWRSRLGKGSTSIETATIHEYVICYAKNIERIDFLPDIRIKDNDSKERLRQWGQGDKREDRPSMYFPVYHKDYGEVYPVKPDGTDGRWRASKEKVDLMLKNDLLLFEKQIDGRIEIYRKILAGSVTQTAQDSILDGEIVKTTAHGSKEITNIFNEKVFDYPKPTLLLIHFLKLVNDEDAIILDFFSGSCTTAHAVLDLNKQDSGSRKFIMVQLPEPCDEASEAFKAGYKTIADIGKERIRRAIKKLSADDADKAQIKKQNDKQATLFDSGNLRESAQSADKKSADRLDLGFKVFKLDKSNFKLWDGADTDISDEKLARQLELHIDHINPKASPEDVLYELLLKAGFKPTEKVKKKQLAGKTVFSIADGGLLICLEDNITRELIDAVAEAEPIQFICLDRAFHGNDQLKANAVQTFEARNQGRDKAQQIVFRTV